MVLTFKYYPIQRKKTFLYINNFNLRCMLTKNKFLLNNPCGLKELLLNYPVINCFFTIFRIILSKRMSYIIPVCFMLPLNNFVFQVQQSIEKQTNSSSNAPNEFPLLQQEKSEQYFETFRTFLQKRNKRLSKKIWQKQEDDLLVQLSQRGVSWQLISQRIPETNSKICKRRYERVKEMSIRWPENLDKMIKSVAQALNYDWPKIHRNLYSQQQQEFPKHSVKEIKERFLLNLRSDIVNDHWTVEEDLALLRIIKGKGTHWRKLSFQFAGRTQLQLKNRYYGILRPLQKKVMRKLNMKLRKIRMQNQH